jgi:hypothetical protein
MLDAQMGTDRPELPPLSSASTLEPEGLRDAVPTAPQPP